MVVHTSPDPRSTATRLDEDRSLGDRHDDPSAEDRSGASPDGPGAPPRIGALEAVTVSSHVGGRWVAALRDVILGGQDGLVNVLGLTLGMAAATGDARVIVAAGLAATMAESIAMAGVAFTATGAEGAWIRRRGDRLLRAMHRRAVDRSDVRRRTLEAVGWSTDRIAEVERVLGDERAAWEEEVATMHAELAPIRETRPATAALTVGLATLAGSAVPLVPFLLLPVAAAMPIALLLAGAALAIAGLLRGRAVGSSPWRAALEMVAIGLLSALAGYVIGLALRVPIAG